MGPSACILPVQQHSLYAMRVCEYTYRTDTLLCDTLLAPLQQFTVVPTAVLLPELCLVNKTVMTIDITYAADEMCTCLVCIVSHTHASCGVCSHVLNHRVTVIGCHDGYVRLSYVPLAESEAARVAMLVRPPPAEPDDSSSLHQTRYARPRLSPAARVLLCDTCVQAQVI